MAFLNETFNINEMPVNESSFEPLPAGWYNCTISGAELKTTKNGTGQYIAVKYDITGPTHQGRVVFGNLNIRNQNTKAEEIGRQQLGDLMRSIGVDRVQDTDQLIGGSLQIKLAIQTSEGYDPRNDVKGYKAIAGAMQGGQSGSGMPPMQKPQQPAQQQPQQGGTTPPPWAR